MTEDMYLSLATELFEKGSWDKDTFIKRVMLYAKEKNIDESTIEELIKRVTNVHEYTIDEKRKILSMITLDGTELKYGDAASSMSDEMVEKFYELEESSLGKNKVNELFNSTNLKEEISNKSSDEPRRQVVKVVKKSVSSKAGVHDVSQNKVDNNVVSNSISQEVVNATDIGEEIVEMNEDHVDNFVNIESEKVEDNNEEVVIPSSLFDVAGDIPQTDEEFSEEAERITQPEKDSTVKKVEVSSERLEKLKNTKGKAINFFLKTAMVVVAVYFLAPVESIGLIGGYCYFADRIKRGTFNPTNLVGKAVKYAVEKVMYIGMNKENEKGGKSR